jgi:ATP-dependent 26S proteasome regulatory subunit
MPKVINAKKAGFTGYVLQGGAYFPQRAIEERKALDPGIYSIGVTQEGSLFFASVSAMTDDLIELPEFVSRTVINQVNKFWSDGTRARYHKYGMVYKRGIMLHGKQGTGKTATVARIMEDHVDKGGIAFFCPATDLLRKAAAAIREIEGDKQFLVIYEELDKLLSYDEGGFLSLLDGEDQIENVVYIATTNYLHSIPPRIKNRPSRFAAIIEVGLPNDETRKAFLTAKVKEDMDIELWVKATEGMSIDQLKDLIISVYCIDVPLKEAVEKILSMNEQEENEDDDNIYANPKHDKLLERMLRLGKRRK